MSFLTNVILAFAVVGSLAIGHRIFKSGMGIIGKAIACLVLLGLMGGMFDPRAPLIGLFNPLAGLLATGGIVIVANHLQGRKQWAKDWRPRVATVAVALGLLTVIWYPVYTGSAGSLLRVPTASASPTPTPPSPSPSSISAPGPTMRRAKPSCADAPTFRMRNQLRAQGLCVDP